MAPIAPPHRAWGCVSFLITLLVCFAFRFARTPDHPAYVATFASSPTELRGAPAPAPAPVPVIPLGTAFTRIAPPASEDVRVGGGSESRVGGGDASPLVIGAAVTPSRAQAAPSPTWPPSARLWSTDGREYSRISLDALWAWSPSARRIVSGDTLRDGSPYVCDDDYGVGQPRGCRFASGSVDKEPARIFAKLPHHFPPARALATAANKKHVFVNGGGDEPLGDRELGVRCFDAGQMCARYLRHGLTLQPPHTHHHTHHHTPLFSADAQDLSDPRLLGFFSINIPRHVPPSARLHGVPLGVERTISPRGMHPGMYTNQRTGWNLAAKLCWMPVLAADVAAGGKGDAPRLLYMNFRTETNPGVRDATNREFSGKTWVTNHVNAGDAVDLVPPGGGVKEAELEASLRTLWEKHRSVTAAPWFRELCGSGPVLPRGLDPALVSELALPGYPLFLKAMASSPFVLAPEGNGVSTHRAWETLYVGTFAVIQEVNAMCDAQYRGLPVMLVKEWAEVTPESLTCFGVELFAKAAGIAVGGAGAPGAGLYPAPYATDSSPPAGSDESRSFTKSEQGVASLLDSLDASGTLSRACAKSIARYAAAHPLSHTGFLSMDSLDATWWDTFIARRSAQLAEGGGGG